MAYEKSRLESSVFMRALHSDDAQNIITESRQVLQKIISGNNSRPFVVIGPCSIHDPKAALEYARKLKDLPMMSPINSF